MNAVYAASSPVSEGDGTGVGVGKGVAVEAGTGAVGTVANVEGAAVREALHAEIAKATNITNEAAEVRTAAIVCCVVTAFHPTEVRGGGVPPGPAGRMTWDRWSEAGAETQESVAEARGWAAAMSGEFGVEERRTRGRA